VETSKQSQKQEITKPSIRIVDCTENKKLVISHTAGCVLITALDKKGQENGTLVFRLKSPYAKNYRKLAQALLLIADGIEERIEIRKP
jgi:hypothetical protein